METTRSVEERPGIVNRLQLSKLPWWGIIIILSGLLVTYLILANENYHATFIFLKDGVITTLRITFFAYILSLVIGLITGIARTSKNTFIYTIATLYVELIRGIPMIVLILYIAFGVIPLLVTFVNYLGNVGTNPSAGTPLEPFFLSLSSYSIRMISMEMRGIFALGIGYGAYEAEVFRAGIQAISRGQMEAARSLGMSYFKAMRLVILPQAVRAVLPPLGNDFISLLKDSALLTVLAVNELTQLSRKRRSSTFRVFETFNVVVFLYLAMTLLLSAGVRYIEKRLKVED